MECWRYFLRKGFVWWLDVPAVGKSVIKSVDHVLFATNSMRVNTEKLFPGLGIQGKAVTIMNGYPESMLKRLLVAVMMLRVFLKLAILVWLMISSVVTL